MVQQLTPRNLLKNQVEPVRFFEVLNQLDDVRVALEWSQINLYLYEDKCSHLYMMKEVNFLEDPRPAVPRHLVNDLDRILHIGVDVDAGLHDGVGALSQHLPSQPVELLEGVGGERGGAGGLLLLPAASLGRLLASSDGRSAVILLSCEKEKNDLCCVYLLFNL